MCANPIPVIERFEHVGDRDGEPLGGWAGGWGTPEEQAQRRRRDGKAEGFVYEDAGPSHGDVGGDGHPS